MSKYEDPEFAGLDLYIRSQLAGASQTYVSLVDLDAKLKTVLAASAVDTHDEGADS
jgi:hypothetical protein